MMILLIVGLIKKILYKNDRSLKTFGRNIDAKVDLSNYATKADVKILLILILWILHQK